MALCGPLGGKTVRLLDYGGYVAVKMAVCVQRVRRVYLLGVVLAVR